MLTRKIQFHTLVTASIVVTVVCAAPWAEIAMAQRGGGDKEAATVQNDDLVLKRYQFKHSNPSSVHATISQLIREGPTRVSVEDRINALLVYTEPQTHEKIEAIVKELDVPGARRVRSQPTPVELRVIWLATGLPPDQSKDLPAELKPVADALAKKDIKELRLLGQMMVKTTSGSEYGALASPMVSGGVVDFKVNGRMSSATDALALSISLSVSKEVKTSVGNTDDGKKSDDVYRSIQLASLNTTIHTKSGEYIVLGLAPVQGITSVFVVQANIIE